MSLDPNAQENMGKRTKLRDLCDTRWSSRVDALFTFRISFVVNALLHPGQGGDPNANQLCNVICTLDFIIAMCVAEQVLQSTTQLSKNLQKSPL